VAEISLPLEKSMEFLLKFLSEFPNLIGIPEHEERIKNAKIANLEML
jgi:hypothetical protein